MLTLPRSLLHRGLPLAIAIVLLPVASTTAEARPCWAPPVDGVIVDAFRAPACVWCAGNRGIDYRVDGATGVRAVASGRVVFAGVVAGVGYVVVGLPNGWRHTYGQLTSTELALGDVVLVGAAIGQAVDRFFFGLRIGDDYADPGPYLGSIVGRRRLIPLDGSAPRPSPSFVRCQARTASR